MTLERYTDRRDGTMGRGSGPKCGMSTGQPNNHRNDHRHAPKRHVLARPLFAGLQCFPNGVAVSHIGGRTGARDWLHFCHMLLVMGGRSRLTVRLGLQTLALGCVLLACWWSMPIHAAGVDFCTLYMNSLFDQPRRWFTPQISKCKREHEISFEYSFAFPFCTFRTKMWFAILLPAVLALVFSLPASHANFTFPMSSALPFYDIR
jgi:hypothetical protein